SAVHGPRHSLCPCAAELTVRAIMPEIPQRPGVRPVRRPARPTPPEVERRTAGRPPAAADDRFFRHLVSSMRNGVIAVHRDGTLALMHTEAYPTYGRTSTADALC